MDGAGEQSTAKVQDALKLFHLAAIERKALAVQQDGQGQPIGFVYEFGVDIPRSVKDAVDKGATAVARITLFKGAAAAEITVANRKDRFFVMQIDGVKLVLGDGP